MDFKNDSALYNQVIEINEIKIQDQELTDNQQSILEKWKEKESFVNPDRDRLQKTIKTISTGTYFEIIDFNKDWVLEMHSVWFYEKGFLRTLMKMILGMALIKTGILASKSKIKTYLLMIIIGAWLSIHQTQRTF